MTLPRLGERLAAASFQPDSPNDYCYKCGLTAKEPPGPDGCIECTDRRPQWDRVVRLGTYTPPLADVIRQIKFSKWRRLGYDLGLIMGRQLATQLPSPRPPIVLVPVPMSWRRRMFRGMDHSVAICRGVRAGLGKGARIARLLKRRHGPSQLQVLPSERSGNVGRMIQPRMCGFRSVSGDSIIAIVDDVMTTGATMRASCRAVGEGLAAAGAGRRKVWALVAARTELPDGDRSEGENEA
jgi:predicted amidophosphoribosyltransferase